MLQALTGLHLDKLALSNLKGVSAGISVTGATYREVDTVLRALFSSELGSTNLSISSGVKDPYWKKGEQMAGRGGRRLQN